MTNFSKGDSSGKLIEAEILPKVEVSDYGLPSENIYSRNLEENVASSSSNKVRSSFIGMGFSPGLVDKAIEENGEDNHDLLLEALFAYSAQQESKSSDSIENLFGDDDETCGHPNQITLPMKEEPDVYDGVSDKEATLLRMSFTVKEVEFAMSKLGEDAPISDLIDFIFALRMAVKHDNDSVTGDAKVDQDGSTEAMFGTMEKTLMLLQMGFSEKEVSSAFDKCGSRVPISELAAAILAEQDGESYTGTPQYCSTSSRMNSSVKTEYDFDYVSRMNSDLLERLKGKRPKEQYVDDGSISKRPKPEYEADSNSSLLEARFGNSRSVPSRSKPVAGRRAKPNQVDTNKFIEMPMPTSCRAHEKMAASAPYFLYGNATNLTRNSWNKISQYLYAIPPDLVNTESFSALSRHEGYIHNLPVENRFHVLPKPPMTINAAIPGAKKWWPSWDTRKHFSFVDSEIAGESHLCERLRRTLQNSKGVLLPKQEEDILDQCRLYNLVWIGQYQLAPIMPEHVERILGCPVHHTQDAGFSLSERFQVLEQCLQIDTLSYHLSGLKSRFLEGLTVLSINTGIGAVEIALHKLGIHLKVVVSVEASEVKRKIVKRWWDKCGMRGELVQMESYQSRKFDAMISNYGGFDLVVCEDACLRSSTSSISSSINAEFDYQNLCEFARILARVRHILQKNK